MSGSVRKGMWPKLPLLLFLVAAVAGMALLGRGGADVARAQTTIVVNTTEDDPAATCLPAGAACSLRGAINRANATTSGEVIIQLPAGVYKIQLPDTDFPFDVFPFDDSDDENVGGDFDIDLETGVKLTIVGAGPGLTIIDGDDLNRVLEVVESGDGVTLKNLTIRNGTIEDGDGGGIALEGGSLTLENVVVSGNVVVDDDGGGIYIGDGSTLTIAGTQPTIVERNQAQFAGGGIYIDEDDTLIIANGATLIVRQNTAADDWGGGIYNDEGTIQFGDEDVAPATATATLVVVGNLSGDFESAGGIYNDGSIVRFAGSVLSFLTVTDNQTGGDGGGIYNADGATIGSATRPITFADISRNTAGDDGGGIWMGCSTGGSSVFLFASTIADNRAGGDGGGIADDGCPPVSLTLVLVNSTVSGNSAGGDGGGIWVEDDIFTLYNVTISGNSAVGDGGGLWVSGRIKVDLSGDGDCVDVVGETPEACSRIDFTTIAFNSAGGNGGGVWAGTTGVSPSNGSVDLIIRGSILSNNTQTEEGEDGEELALAEDCFDVDLGDEVGNDENVVALYWSLVGSPVTSNPGCVAPEESGTTFGLNPQLEELSDWGHVWPVVVETHKIPATSPAVDRVPEVNTPPEPGTGDSPCGGAPPAPPLTDFDLDDARGATRDPDTGIFTQNSMDGNGDGQRGCDAGAFESTPVDISLSKSDSADPAFRNGLLTYTITVNTGPNSLITWATGVTVTDQLPEGVSLVSASASNGGSCTPSNGTVVCTWPYIADGSSRTVTINVTVTASGGTLSNTATVSQNEFDPTAGDHSDTETTAVAAVGAPGAPSMVAIWPDSGTTAMITFQPPEGPSGVVEFYRLQSALNFEFNFAVTTTDIPAGSLPFPGNIIQVGLPTVDGWTFYYRLAACNSTGCSPFVFAGALAARQFPSGTTQHWNFVMGAFEFAGTVFAWGQNQVSVPGKVSDFNFWSGVQGFGGVLRASCNTVAPGDSCTKSWASDNQWVSVSQSFPPFGEVGIAVRVH